MPEAPAAAASAATATPSAAGALATLAARLHAALPQTQCQRCGYADCVAYAQAMSSGQVGIDRCPPGGAEGIARLAALTGQPVRPLDAACGEEAPRSLAVIDEAWCIGCTKCIDACPTDAILGAAKRMHTVIDVHCTGCELCIPVCPVDCIALENASGSATGWAAWSGEQAAHALRRYRMHIERTSKDAGYSPISSENEPESPPPDPAAARRAAVAAALAAARALRSGGGGAPGG